MLNELQLGDRCSIATLDGRMTIGDYLGVETPHGDWHVLLADRGCVESIPIGTIAAVSMIHR